MVMMLRSKTEGASRGHSANGIVIFLGLFCDGESIFVDNDHYSSGNLTLSLVGLFWFEFVDLFGPPSCLWRSLLARNDKVRVDLRAYVPKIGRFEFDENGSSQIDAEHP